MRFFHGKRRFFLKIFLGLPWKIAFFNVFFQKNKAFTVDFQKSTVNEIFFQNKKSDSAGFGIWKISG